MSAGRELGRAPDRRESGLKAEFHHLITFNLQSPEVGSLLGWPEIENSIHKGWTRCV